MGIDLYIDPTKQYMNNNNKNDNNNNNNNNNVNKLIEQVELEMTCCICIGVLKKPLVLACGHMLCSQCSVQKNSVRLGADKRCPICRKSQTVWVVKEKKINKNSKNKMRMRQVNENLKVKKNGICLRVDFQSIYKKFKILSEKYSNLLVENVKKDFVIKKQATCLQNFNIEYDSKNNRMIQLIKEDNNEKNEEEEEEVEEIKEVEEVEESEEEEEEEEEEDDDISEASYGSCIE